MSRLSNNPVIPGGVKSGPGGIGEVWKHPGTGGLNILLISHIIRDNTKGLR